MKRHGWIVASLVLTGLCACTPMQHDYTAFRARMPQSILVIPPLNQSSDVNAPYSYLSTISRPLVDCGYYVFPVAVIDAMMKENGLPTPGEMNAVPLDKLREIIGADAVLYVTIEEWGQKYQVISSNTVVRARARLVDTETGATLWEGKAHAVENSGGAENGIVGMLVNALISQVIDSMTDRVHDLAHTANRRMVFDPNVGFLPGPRHPDYETDPRGR